MIEVRRNDAAQRFELIRDGTRIGVLEYSYADRATVLEHIEVDEAFSGQGLASRFTRAVLDQMRFNDESVIPQCPFVREFLRDNPQFRLLVPPDHLSDLQS